MGDSDDEHDRRRARDKFRRERSDYNDRRRDREERSSRRDEWSDRRREPSWESRRRGEYREFDRGRRDSSGRHQEMSPPIKRVRRDWDEPYHGAGDYNVPYSGVPTHNTWSHPDVQQLQASQQQDARQQRVEVEQQPHPQASPGPAMMTFKQFLNAQDDNIGDEEAFRKYQEYKMEFRKTQINDFFLQHKEEEWFRMKYHPKEMALKQKEYKKSMQRRLSVFLNLLKSGRADDISLDIDNSEAIIKLLDAVVIKLEGGLDSDLVVLDCPPTPPPERRRSSSNPLMSPQTDDMATDDKKEETLKNMKEIKKDPETGPVSPSSVPLPSAPPPASAKAAATKKENGDVKVMSISNPTLEQQQLQHQAQQYYHQQQLYYQQQYYSNYDPQQQQEQYSKQYPQGQQQELPQTSQPDKDPPAQQKGSKKEDEPKKKRKRRHREPYYYDAMDDDESESESESDSEPEPAPPGEEMSPMDTGKEDELLPPGVDAGPEGVQENLQQPVVDDPSKASQVENIVQLPTSSSNAKLQTLTDDKPDSCEPSVGSSQPETSTSSNGALTEGGSSHAIVETSGETELSDGTPADSTQGLQGKERNQEYEVETSSTEQAESSSSVPEKDAYQVGSTDNGTSTMQKEDNSEIFPEPSSSEAQGKVVSMEAEPSSASSLPSELTKPASEQVLQKAEAMEGGGAQLLGIVVRKERPELEEQKDALVINIAANKKKLEELEDEILRLLQTAQGSLLDDEQLVNTLNSSKTTSQEVAEQLQVSEQTEIKIDAAREGYRPCAQRASILFFVLNDMGKIDPMYQFSLDAYIDLFNNSIEKSQRSPNLEIRIQNLNDYHTYAVYKYTCRGLFERHKLLFSFQMCSKILEAAGKLNMDEYNFFLRGGVVLDREGQMDNPCTQWLNEASWDNITELDKLPNFHGIVTSFEQYPRDWNIWYTSAEPENTPLPGEWENACNELQRMLIVRSLRPDRVSFTATSFIVNNLGSKFVEPPVLDMASVVEDSSTRTPLIFVLSPGVDPTSALLQLAENSGMSNRFHALSLGQGQAPIATRMIKEGVKDGNWVFLANCHLSLSWMPQLDKLVEQLQVEEPHPDFRLWLSSSPHPEFPISILQVGIKMTTEPPKGLKANMKRLYQLITEQQFSRCHKQDKYKKLLFSLCFFHSVLLERRKFLMLGWNIQYGFNDSDFEVSENLLSIYLDEYEETPWDALKYLVAGVNYGGHVTDDFDRRLLHSYINEQFCDAAIQTPYYKLSSLPTYYIPKDGPLSTYREYISMLPNVDHPETFGQHPNADIASQIIETRNLFGTLLSLQPQIPSAGGQGESREEKVLELAADVLKKVPEEIDYEQTAKIMSDDPSPLNVVLLQEIERFNALLRIIKASLIDLEKGIKGLVVMSSDLEETFYCIYDAKVPPLWGKAYPSNKPLGNWTRDLMLRVDQFAKWATTAHQPVIFWMSGFTFPTGFLTAVLQTCARQNNVSVDSLSWEFVVSTVDDSNITQQPKDGVWIRGLFLEGAGWDKKNACLIEAEPMQLVSAMPTIHFKPVENKKKSGKGVYACPCYYYPNRAGTSGRASFVVAVDLKAGAMTSDHWIKRGTALLMSLDY